MVDFDALVRSGSMDWYTIRQVLFTCFADFSIVTIGGKTGIISSIEHEDGSGHKFNVTLRKTPPVFLDVKTKNPKSSKIRTMNL